MDQAELDRLKALCAAATPGPWVVSAAHLDYGGYEIQSSASRVRVVACGPDGIGVQRREDAEFIRITRTALPALLAAYETVMRQRDQARTAWRAHRAMCTCLEAGEVPVPPLDRADDDGWMP